jgi:galactose-3-O-sulfotransferase
VHIPKTAGTTVRTIFLHAYPRSAIRNSGNALRDPESSRRRVARLAQSTGGAVRVVVGHTPYGLHKAHMPADALYVTLLRDPVDQMLSSYHFLLPPGRQSPQCLPAREGPRILPLPPEETSLAEMLERGVYLLDNLATRMLADRETPFGELGPEDLQQAKDNLARFAVVGITERFDESIVLMQRALALGAVPYASQKVNSAAKPSGDLRRGANTDRGAQPVRSGAVQPRARPLRRETRGRRRARGRGTGAQADLVGTRPARRATPF